MTRPRIHGLWSSLPRASRTTNSVSLNGKIYDLGGFGSVNLMNFLNLILQPINGYPCPQCQLVEVVIPPQYGMIKSM